MRGDKTHYEWVVEEIDENDDVIDPMFSDTFKDAIVDANAIIVSPENNVFIGLVRYVFESDGNLAVREYAYIKNGILPTEFDDGHRIPNRFHDEISKELIE